MARVGRGIPGFNERSLLSYGNVRLPCIKSSFKAQNCTAKSTDGWRKLCHPVTGVCVWMYLITEFHLASKYKNVFLMLVKTHQTHVFCKTSNFEINSCAYLGIFYPIPKARKAPLWVALEESTNAQRWTTELLNLHLLMLSKIKWKPKFSTWFH